MKRVYTTANGRQVNLDSLLAQNEDAIAVGNMKVNVRGDQLGSGGKIEATKEQVMKDYYKLNSPVAVDTPPQPHQVRKPKDLTDDWVEPAKTPEADDMPLDTTDDTTPVLRGSLADSVAKAKSTTQPAKKTGPSRI